jgi:TorA maturation chaperone TorD
MSTAPMTFVPTLAPEETARANIYGLIARFFQAPPDAALLQLIATDAGLEAEEGTVAQAWRDLAQAAVSADAEAAREEYDAVFIGVGKAPLTLYTSAYSIRHSNELPLVELRRDLAVLQLGRRGEVNEPEDHIAALCEVMRHLIAVQKPALEDQKRFFERWIWPVAPSLCGAIEKSAQIRFYRPVGRFAFAFFELEHSAFEML